VGIKLGNNAPETEPSGFKRRGRILFTLLVVLAFVGLAPLATVAWKLIDIEREALTTAQQEYQLLLVRAITDEVDIYIESLHDQIVRVAQTLGGTVRPSGGGRQDEIRRSLSDVVDERVPYLRYNYFSAQRMRSLSAGELPEQLEPLFASGLRDAAEILSQNVESRSGRAIISDPILLDSRPSRTVLVVSAPVVSGGKFRGVLSALVDLQTVWESVVKRNRTPHVIFALDREGQVFASTDPVAVRPGEDVSRSELVIRFLSARGRTRETLPFVEVEEGEERKYLGSYEKSGQGWGVFVQAPLEEVYHPVRAMVDSTLTWAAFALVLVVLCAIVFAGTLSTPIKRLAAVSRAFAAGDYSARVTFRSGNEIGELAYAFNKMAAEIEDQIRRLRQAADENKELFLGTIRALAQAIDAKDPYTRGHSVRVNRFSVIIAQELGLPEEQIQEIHVASLMHDVGKIGIDDHILKKPGKLTPDEFEVMKTHAVLGANIMQPIRRMDRVLPGLRWHHERWKGGGYPDGLVGEQIPLMARVIAVADTFDALTTHRPYQKARSFDDALRLLNDLKGVAYDERIVEAFNRAYRQGLIRPETAEEERPPAQPGATSVA
jgi:HD-GYP domain-containing protein (c-di-GMP phosphodiesterase class II)